LRAAVVGMTPTVLNANYANGRIDANLKIGVPVTADIAFDSAVFVLFEKTLGMQ